LQQRVTHVCACYAGRSTLKASNGVTTSSETQSSECKYIHRDGQWSISLSLSLSLSLSVLIMIIFICSNTYIYNIWLWHNQIWYNYQNTVIHKRLYYIIQSGAVVTWKSNFLCNGSDMTYVYICITIWLTI
jgi:hypothetical protein